MRFAASLCPLKLCIAEELIILFKRVQYELLEMVQFCKSRRKRVQCGQVHIVAYHQLWKGKRFHAFIGWVCSDGAFYVRLSQCSVRFCSGSLKSGRLNIFMLIKVFETSTNPHSGIPPGLEGEEISCFHWVGM